jgi:hypothetical protein
MAKGHLDKGPCWCFEIAVPGHILKRLAADRIEYACLCRSCLETVARLSRQFQDVEEVIAEVHKAIHSPAAAEKE